MKCLTLVLLASAACAQPYELGLSFNSGGATKVYRGWPLIVRGVAFWTQAGEDGEEGGTQGVELDPGGAVLAIYSASGAEVKLPFRPVALAGAPVRLDAQRLAAEAIWVLEGDVALPGGRYAGRLAWGDAAAAITEFEVAEPPEALSRPDRTLLAWLRSEASRLTGDAESALEAVRKALEKDPDAIGLHTQKAVVEAEAGRHADALVTLSTALELFERQFGNASHPPYEILEVRRRIWTGLLQIR